MTIDLRTLVLNQAIAYGLCLVVSIALWLQYRRRFSGLGFWTVDILMQMGSLLLLVLRGIIPEWVSILGAHVLLVGGLVFFYAGLEQFFGIRRKQTRNVVIMVVLLAVHIYFTFFQPNLAVRNINNSLAGLIIFIQCAWLMLRLETKMPILVRWAAVVFGGYGLVSVARIVVNVVMPRGDDFFGQPGPLEAILLLAYEILIFTSTFLTYMMVNRRLLSESDDQREALQKSEARYRQLVELSPAAIVVYRDGRLVFANPATLALMGAGSPDELLGKPVMDFVHRDYRALARQRIAGALATGKVAPLLEQKFVRLDGRVIDVEVVTRRLEYQGQLVLQTLIRDITARKQAEAALRESEERYRSLFTNNHTVMLIIAPEDGAIVDANPAAAAYYGWTQEELRQKKISQINTLSPSEVQAEMDKARLEQRAHFLFQHQLADGSLRDVEVFGGPITLQERPLLYSIIHDITARKRTEAVLRLRLQLLEFAAEHSLEDMLQYALDEIGKLIKSPIGFYHFVEADQKTLSLQAWSTRTLEEFCRAEGRGQHYDIDQAGVWVDCVHQRRPVIHNDYASLPHRKGLPPGHAALKRELVVPTMSEGRIVSILGVGNKATDYEEQDVELVSYIADVIWRIVERKRTDEQLKTYQRRLEAQNLELRKLRLAIEQSGSTIVITDTDGVIEYVNSRFEETTGYTLQEVLGGNTRLLKYGDQDAGFYRELWETIADGRIWQGEFHNRRRDGAPYWESATVAPVADATGTITHFIAVKEDITERKAAEEALRRYAGHLAAQNAELDAFAHTVAHDLKNPLGIVIGYAELLEVEYADLPPDVLHEGLRSIVLAGEKLNTIIDELLLLAGVRKQEVTPEPLAMTEIVQGACARLELAIQETGAHLVIPEPTSWPVALGYAPWVEEVWANYLSNALKYGGTPPYIELGYNAPASVAGNPTPGIRFWVRDNGAGLTPEAQTKLFTEFTSLGQARARGHGLGLSIVQRIIHKLGGQVGVESAVGAGSCFWFKLPVALFSQDNDA